MDTNFNIMTKSIGIAQVKGKFVKLKGYSNLKLFSHKLNKMWYIREFYSGRRVGTGTTEATAKKKARAYLSSYTLQEIQDRIDSVEEVNSDVIE